MFHLEDHRKKIELEQINGSNSAKKSPDRLAAELYRPPGSWGGYRIIYVCGLLVYYSYISATKCWRSEATAKAMQRELVMRMEGWGGK